MNKKEEFKEFVKEHPELANVVKTKEQSWQDLFELYDMYGANSSVWDKYKESDRAPLKDLTNIVKNVNMDNVQKYINNAQKAINVIEELTTKKTPTSDIIPPKTPRPISKFFGD